MTGEDILMSFAVSAFANIFTKIVFSDKHQDEERNKQDCRTEGTSQPDDWRQTLKKLHNENYEAHLMEDIQRTAEDIKLTKVQENKTSPSINDIISVLQEEKEKELLELGKRESKDLLWRRVCTLNTAEYTKCSKVVNAKIIYLYKSCDFKYEISSDIHNKYLIVINPKSYSGLGRTSDFSGEIFLLTVNHRGKITEIIPSFEDWVNDKITLEAKDELVLLCDLIEKNAKDDPREVYLKAIARGLELASHKNIISMNLQKLLKKHKLQISNIQDFTRIPTWRFLSILNGHILPDEKEVETLSRDFNVTPEYFFKNI